MLNVNVSLYEYTDDKGKTVDVNVWIPNSDSRSEIAKQARSAALEQLKRAIAALEAEES
jgi:hypothetical protein